MRPVSVVLIGEGGNALSVRLNMIQPTTNSDPVPRPKHLGRIERVMLETERVDFLLAGELVGFVEIVRVPNDAKIRVAFCFDRDIKVQHRKQKRTAP